MLKKLMLVVAVLLACSILGNAQSIYTLTNREIASIPFHFSVGNMVFPAGNYTFLVNLQRGCFSSTPKTPARLLPMDKLYLDTTTPTCLSCSGCG
ncbi:MAG: hypothetical protein ABSC15_12390 [Terriglobales bacterium]